MGCKNLLLVCLLLVLPVRAWATEDDVCAELHAFRTAPFAKDAADRPIRRTVELHWIGNIYDGSGVNKSCIHNGNEAAKVLCPILLSSYTGEFIVKIPVFVMQCYGWKVGGFAGDAFIEKGQIKFHATDERGKKLENSDRYLVMEIDMQPRKKEHLALKFSAIPYEEKPPEKEPFLIIDEPDNPPLKTPY